MTAFVTLVKRHAKKLSTADLRTVLTIHRNSINGIYGKLPGEPKTCKQQRREWAVTRRYTHELRSRTTRPAT